MHIAIRIESEGQEEELRSLDGWLRQEPAVRRTATVSLHTQAAAPGSMGGLIDSLGLITSNGWSAASFALSLVTWRQTRPRPPKIIIRRGDVEISLTEATEEEVRRLVNALEQADETSSPS
ncbi:effector-associated constant component EACC1 [Streptomyces roseochromogenus]|uniref:effector-associated constant component EACC1 n=1 Tax=Streptomyces roseochromogenus TaxID=285450 RepID=UPI0009961D11|nr:hypothetical protein [Streptomyces roseochromogenus]